MSTKKVAFYTLGCKLNYSETSTIGRSFTEAGFEVVNFTDAADVYVINTNTHEMRIKIQVVTSC